MKRNKFYKILVLVLLIVGIALGLNHLDSNGVVNGKNLYTTIAYLITWLGLWWGVIKEKLAPSIKIYAIVWLMMSFAAWYMVYFINTQNFVPGSSELSTIALIFYAILSPFYGLKYLTGSLTVYFIIVGIFTLIVGVLGFYIKNKIDNYFKQKATENKSGSAAKKLNIEDYKYENRAKKINTEDYKSKK